MLVAVVAVVARNLAYKLSLIGFCWRLLWKYRPLLWNKRSSWNICPNFLQNLLLLVSGRQICILHCFHISSLIPQCRALPGRSPPRFTEPHGGNGLRELENVDGPKLQTMDHPPRFDGFVGKNLPKHIGSMYGIFTHIWSIFMVNLGRYTIHDPYMDSGNCLSFFFVILNFEHSTTWKVILSIWEVGGSSCHLFS